MPCSGEKERATTFISADRHGENHPKYVNINGKIRGSTGDDAISTNIYMSAKHAGRVIVKRRQNSVS